MRQSRRSTIFAPSRCHVVQEYPATTTLTSPTAHNSKRPQQAAEMPVDHMLKYQHLLSRAAQLDALTGFVALV
jgi:hypothetical protein